MLRPRHLAWIVFGFLLLCSRPAAAQTLVGAGPGYLFDSPGAYWLVTGMGWIPAKAPDVIVFKPLVFSPRIVKYFGNGGFQGDANMLWDIPLAAAINAHPYIGMGAGVQHFGDENFSETKPVLNIVTGFRYKKPEWREQVVLEAAYSSGIHNANTMVINFAVLFPLPGRK
jgi:hypothetical protein